MSIPRYKINILWGWYGFWQDDENGKFCEYRDYARLKAEVERLRKAGDAMASSIQFNEEIAQDYNGPTIVHQSVKAWNAAKESKQS